MGHPKRFLAIILPLSALLILSPVLLVSSFHNQLRQSHTLHRHRSTIILTASMHEQQQQEESGVDDMVTTTTTMGSGGRRSFLIRTAASAMVVTATKSSPTFAATISGGDNTENSDLTSRLFNEDGSLRGGGDSEQNIASRTISVVFGDNSGTNNGANSKKVVPLFSIDGSAPSSKAVLVSKTPKSTTTTPAPISTPTATIITASTTVAPTPAPSLVPEGAIGITYDLPSKWTDGPGYLDTFESDGISPPKACERIVVYRVPIPGFEDNIIENIDDDDDDTSADSVNVKQPKKKKGGLFGGGKRKEEDPVYKVLDKAASQGVANSIGVSLLPDNGKGVGFPSALFGADVIGGKKVERSIITTPSLSSSSSTDSSNDGVSKTNSSSNRRKHYDYDMASAPKRCASAGDGSTSGDSNLGLGFCPYDAVYLVSATILRPLIAAASGLGTSSSETPRSMRGPPVMVVFVLIATDDEWKRSSSDLRRVRDSFRVLNNA